MPGPGGFGTVSGSPCHPVPAPVTRCQLRRVLCRVPRVAQWPGDSFACRAGDVSAEPAQPGEGDTVAVGTEPGGAGGPCQRGWHVPPPRLRAQGTQQPHCRGHCQAGGGPGGGLGPPGEVGASFLHHQSHRCARWALEPGWGTLSPLPPSPVPLSLWQLGPKLGTVPPVRGQLGTPRPFTRAVEWRQCQGPLPVPLEVAGGHRGHGGHAIVPGGGCGSQGSQWPLSFPVSLGVDSGPVAALW